MCQQKETIETLEKLLGILYPAWSNRGKTHADLVRYRQSEIFVREYFDDGKGHSGAFSSINTPVAEAVFEQAKTLGYIQGKLKPGYVSSGEFVLSKYGEEVSLKNFRKAQEAHEKDSS